MIVTGGFAGAPPPVDLDMERRNGDFVRTLIREGLCSTAHDISDGGMLVALGEMALAGRTGFTLAPHGGASPSMRSISARTRDATCLALQRQTRVLYCKERAVLACPPKSSEKQAATRSPCPAKTQFHSAAFEPGMRAGSLIISARIES